MYGLYYLLHNAERMIRQLFGNVNRNILYNVILININCVRAENICTEKYKQTTEADCAREKQALICAAVLICAGASIKIDPEKTRREGLA